MHSCFLAVCCYVAYTECVLCICFQIKGIGTVAVDAYVVVTWLPPYEASPTAKMIVSSNVIELVLQL